MCRRRSTARLIPHTNTHTGKKEKWQNAPLAHYWGRRRWGFSPLHGDTDLPERRRRGEFRLITCWKSCLLWRKRVQRHHTLCDYGVIGYVTSHNWMYSVSHYVVHVISSGWSERRDVHLQEQTYKKFSCTEHRTLRILNISKFPNKPLNTCKAVRLCFQTSFLNLW